MTTDEKLELLRDGHMTLLKFGFLNFVLSACALGVALFVSLRAHP